MLFKEKVSQSSMTDREYVQNMPATHLFHQKKVNAELWYQWNLIDHDKAVHGSGWDYYSPEKTIFSAAVEHARKCYPVRIPANVPPALFMGYYAINSRRWKQEQESRLNARIGEIFFVKNGTGDWDMSGIYITYALERVDAPRRWNKYCVHHFPSERFADVIKQHME